MSNLKGFAFISAVLCAAHPAFAAPDCRGDWVNQAAPVHGVVFGTNAFAVQLGQDLTFSLLPDESGWRVQMVTATGQTVPTRPVARGIPPVKGLNNPAMSFVFGPDIFDPALNPEFVVPGRPANIAAVEPSPGKQGSGELTVLDQGFAPEPGARKIYMKFEGCVRWNNGRREPNLSQYASDEDIVNFPAWVINAFEDCGLPETLLLSGRMPRPDYRQAAWLEPDIDGDGRPDLAALVVDAETGAYSLAVCQQAGKHLSLLGDQRETDRQSLSHDFLTQVDWWSIDGRSLVLGIEGAGGQRVFLSQTEGFQSRWEGE